MNIRNKIFLIASFLALTSMLSACGPMIAVPAVGNAVSVATTDKTLDDHYVSYVEEKDCSTVRLNLGLSYCKEDQHKAEQQTPRLYCYRELGRVTCYEQPDAYSNRTEVEEKTLPVQR